MTAVLRDASETAERERLRLEASTGRTRLGALARRFPNKLRYLGSEEAARNGLRYQPVAWTAIALAAVAFFFPGRDDTGADAPALAHAPVMTAPAPTTTTTTTSTSLPAPAMPRAVVTPVVVPPPTPTTMVSPVTTTTAPAAPTPLTVRGFGWASTLSGSGISSAGVPDGSMPVGNRLGRLDKAAFVRLAGTDRTLTLVEDGAGAREALGAGAVMACAITDAGWVEEPDQSFDEAPAWDADACAAGVESDGTWTFDLGAFADRAGDRGFALVPEPDAPADFQVAFRTA